MRKSLACVVLVALVGAAIAACGSDSSGSAPSPAGRTATVAQSMSPATATHTATPAVTAVVGGSLPGSPSVSLADDGKTISLAVGETFLLALGDGAWTVDVDNQAVVSRVPNITVVRGAQGVYAAHAAGTAHMTAKNGSLTFKLTIVVK